MLFNTTPFALFLLIVIAVNFALPPRLRRWFLLAASYYFYMCWSVRYISVILAITLIDFYAGIAIESAREHRRRLYLALSIFCNFGLLFVFKYLTFFAVILHLPASVDVPHWAIPLGISFHTFQAVSYTVDVYRRKVPAERNLGVYALYVAFFPQMVAGPIERPGNLIPQLHQPKPFDVARVTSGLRTALWGLIKKVVIADLASTLVNNVWANPASYSTTVLWVAAVLFSIQIYCDFSGYSDIAIGTARILGYDLTINFRQPYFARSISGFWRCWHISLSTWFRDYLYIPLGGSKRSTARWCFNIAVVFLASGLWHGANATFIAWGALHAAYILIGTWTLPLRTRAAAALGLNHFPRFHVAGQILVTNLLVTLSWVIFRAPTLYGARYFLARLFAPDLFRITDLFRAGLPRFEMAFLLTAIPCVFAIEYLRRNPPQGLRNLWQKRSFRWPVYAAAVYTVIFFGVFERTEFIYFQF